MIAGHDRTHLIDGVEKQIAAVRSIIDGISPEPIDIRGALCLADPEGLPLLRTQSVRGIIVDGPRWAAKLARRAGSVKDEQITVLYERLIAALPAA
ncbi:MAG: hypothetical protein WBQ18_19725 [Solirubrobacteraceae bacterium]